MKYLIMTMIVSTVYPDRSSTAVSPIICSKALENSAIVSGVTVAIVSPTAAPATSSTADLSGYTVETFGRSARAASLGNISLDATEVTRLLPPR
jgi:hypothetical protein